jgi:hypothetical protein
MSPPPPPPSIPDVWRLVRQLWSSVSRIEMKFFPASVKEKKVSLNDDDWSFSLFSSGSRVQASTFHDISKSVFTSHPNSRCRSLQSEEYADSMLTVCWQYRQIVPKKAIILIMSLLVWSRWMCRMTSLLLLTTRTLGSWVIIPLGEWMFFGCTVCACGVLGR